MRGGSEAVQSVTHQPLPLLHLRADRVSENSSEAALISFPAVPSIVQRKTFFDFGVPKNVTSAPQNLFSIWANNGIFPFDNLISDVDGAAEYYVAVIGNFHVIVWRRDCLSKCGVGAEEIQSACGLPDCESLT